MNTLPKLDTALDTAPPCCHDSEWAAFIARGWAELTELERQRKDWQLGASRLAAVEGRRRFPVRFDAGTLLARAVHEEFAAPSATGMPAEPGGGGGRTGERSGDRPTYQPGNLCDKKDPSL